MSMMSFAIGNLLRRPARSILTVSAIALGISAVVALTSIAWGFEASWQQANDARGTDLIVTRIASENAMPSPFREREPREVVRAFPHVAAVEGLLSEMLTVSDHSPPVFVFGWSYKSYLWDHLRLLQGRWPQSDEASEVMVGALAADLLHKGPGDFLEIEGLKFAIVGVFESNAMVENGAVLMTLTQAQRVTDKPGKVNVLNLKLDSNAGESDLAFLRKEIPRALPGYTAITSGELVRSNAIVKIAKAMSSVTILIVCLVGGLIIFNSMLMSINERTREVGILLALGWSPRTIIRLIFTEAALLSATGGVVGTILGVGLVLLLEHAEILKGKINAIISMPFLISVIVVTAIVGVCGGLDPAIKAARMLPAKALRYE